MAHFAKIENDTVTNVVVIDNAHESYGEAFLNDLGLIGSWIQTSFHSNIRTKFAGIGDTYNAEKDRFEPSSDYASWEWNEEHYNYIPPTPMPDDGTPYIWNEDSLDWVKMFPEEELAP